MLRVGRLLPTLKVNRALGHHFLQSVPALNRPTIKEKGQQVNTFVPFISL